MTAPSYPPDTGAAAVDGHPLQAILMSVPIGALVMALGADIALMVTAEPLWGETAKWLLLAALASGVLAALVDFLDLIGTNRVPTMVLRLGHRIGNVLVLFVTGANYLLRTGGDVAAVSSYGIMLTAAAVLLVMLTGWLGGELVFRHGGVIRSIGETDNPEFLPGDRPDLGRR